MTVWLATFRWEDGKDYQVLYVDPADPEVDPLKYLGQGDPGDLVYVVEVVDYKALRTQKTMAAWAHFYGGTPDSQELDAQRHDDAVAAFNALPDPVEDTIEGCIAALAAEGFNEAPTSPYALSSSPPVTLADWRHRLKEWRYHHPQEPP